MLILPGLTSSSQTSYVRTLVQTLNKVGASVVIFNNRGNGGVSFKVCCVLEKIDCMREIDY